MAILHAMSRVPKSSGRILTGRKLVGWDGLSLPSLAGFVAVFLFCPAVLSSQTAGAQSQNSAGTTSPSPVTSAKNAAARAAHTKAGRAKAKQAAEAQQAAAETPKPAAPPPPDWPANDKAEPAAVDWNGGNLSVTAKNASLAQILHDISTATGVKVEGLGADQRVFGNYGPAGARDVIAELMEGSGYNVMIIGDKGEGTPRELVLTVKASVGKVGAPPNGQPSQNGEEEAVEEPEQPQPQPEPEQRRPPGGPPQPGQGPRTPQQVMQDLQQRQQQQMANPAPQ